MKRIFYAFAFCLMALSFYACNNTKNDGSNITDGPQPDSVDQNRTNPTTLSSTPLTVEDSAFVLEAAIGGLKEVESGKIAQQNAASDRVKNFGAMMVTDHTKANEELKSYASSKGMTLPATLPADVQKELEGMRNMKGRSFDQHYINMMLTDHQKTIDKFQNQANSGGDAQLKTWASANLPVLKKHLDSVQAIKNGL